MERHSSVQKICGFIVVRKPEWSSSDLLKPSLRVNGKRYHGVDRLRWEDFEVEYYEGRLPGSLLPIWQERKRDNADFSGLDLLKGYEKAQEVLRFSGNKSEIIAVWSAELEEIKGATGADLTLDFLGIDCFSLGEWSVLLDGVYLRPASFVETIPKLNRWGLLVSDAESERVFDRYLALASAGLVEPLMEKARMTSISVFRLSR
jgi:hypothetical protein